MELSLPLILGLLRETLTDPRASARRLISLGLPHNARWIALALIAALSAIMAHVAMSLMAVRVPEGQGGPLPSPIITAMMQMGVLVLSALLTHHVGRWRGGRGRLEDAVLLMVWLQLVLVCVQVAQILMLLILPPLADLLGFAAIVLFLWLLTGFIMELHGFESRGRVLLGIVMTVFGMAFALVLILSILFGVAPA